MPRAAKSITFAATPPNADWTPALVADAIVEAMIWARRFGGPVGPRAWGTINLNFKAGLNDHLAEGWGLPEVHRDRLAKNSPQARHLARRPLLRLGAGRSQVSQHS